MSELFINKKVWRTFTEAETERYVDDVFSYYRQNGFPYYPTGQMYRIKEYGKLSRYTANTLSDNIIKQTMHGLALCWSYHPHSFNVRCRGKMTALEAFNDDEIFKRVIRKRMKMGDNMSDAGIRKMLKIFSGVQAVSNFRPTSARDIYNRYCDGGVTWDMSTGFGGRLLGFNESRAKLYIGTDPSTQAYKSNFELATDFVNKPIRLHKIGSEDYIPSKGILDLAFTSPPYFDIEEYENELSQSYKKFPQYESWLSGFLNKTVENARYGLKKDGILALNVNEKIGQYLLEVIEDLGFYHVETLQLSLSKINSKGFKYEPIYIFKKRN